MPSDDAEEGSSAERRSSGCCSNPEGYLYRFVGLILMCLLGFGSYFCYDNPGALQDEMKDALGINTYEFSELYAWYSWPNTVLPVIGGYLMDRVFGIRLGTSIFAIFIVLGQGIFALGAFINSFPAMEIGRFVFGLGGESLAVAQNAYAVSWFKGKELNMVFGFQLSVTRIGSTVNFLAVGPLYHWLKENFSGEPYQALGLTLAIAGLTCIMSLICSIILGWMDKRASRLLNKETQGEDSTIRVKDILAYPIVFWFICGVALSFYVAIFPFISLGQVFFIRKFGYSSGKANFITGLIYLISAPASPLFGYLIDKTGRNVLYIFISVGLTLVSHYILALSFINPYIPIVVMGISYSLLASALWPLAAYVVPENQLGTAYGLMQAIQNVGLALCTMLCGLTVDNHGYIWLEMFFIGWVVVAMLCTLGIWLIDFSTTGYLNMGAKERLEYDERSNFLVEEDPTETPRHDEYFRQGMRPRTHFEIRNRYLSRIGAKLPPHLGTSFI